MRAFRFSLAVLTLSALGGCVTPTAPVQVTHFHAENVTPVADGSIAIFAQDQALEDSLEHRTYAAAVRQQLQGVGYRDVAGDQPSDYAAYITVSRDRILSAGRRSPVSVGVGGGTGGYRSGVGIGVGFNLGGERSGERVATELFVRIANRETGAAVWEGRAVTDAAIDSPAAQPGMAAARLAEALFQGFPGQSGETIRVE